MDDTESVARFVTRFQQLLAACNDDPNIVEANYHLDPVLRELTDRVSGAAIGFEIDDQHNPSRVALSTDETFVELWRKYEKQFQPLIKSSWFKLDGQIHKLKRRDRSLEEEWELADGIAEELLQCSMTILELAEEEFEMREGLHDNGQVEMDYDNGFKVFRHWLPGLGFNSRQALRRHQLLRIVNISHTVVSKGGDTKTGVIGYLTEAHKAFILGADFGALILLRSVMENVLLKLYSSVIEPDPLERCKSCGSFAKDHLRLMIYGCKSLSDTEKQALLKIKVRADNLVHAGDYRQVRKLVGNERKFELFMADAFERLRSLIEKSPI